MLTGAPKLFAQPTSDSLTFKLDQYMAALTELKNFNGNILISKNGKTLLRKTYNISGAEDGLRVSENSKFIIASVSKVFIKYGILKLVELNKIKLEDKLKKYIPDFPNGNKITIEHLLHHHSGLPRELADYEKYDSLSLQKILSLAKLEKLEFKPGAKYLYSNVGYFILHYLIDKVSGIGYLPFIQKEILDKMKLKNTFEFNTVKNTSTFAYGFNYENGKIVPTSKKNINRFETGNYLSTVDDLFSFSEQLLSGRTIRKSLALKMFGKDSLLMQAGGRPGYRAFLYKNLKTGVTFIFTANYTDLPFQEMTTDIINIIDNKPYSIPQKINRKAIKVAVDTLNLYTGKFALEDDPRQMFTITVVNDNLVIEDNDGEKITIFPDSETTFFDNPLSKDGYVFTWNKQTGQFDFTIITNGLKLKTKRVN